MKKYLNKLENLFLYLLPIVIFFSFYPVIRLGESDSMHFELSLPLIWLFIFGIISLFRLPNILAKYGFKKSALLLLFPIWMIASIFWSKNALRGVLTTGIAALIFLSVINIVNMKLSKEFLKKILKIYLISSVVAATLCIIQSFLDVLGAGRDITLLCPGCVYSVLGFPHPNGLAIEPQFMGNMLIAPALLSLLFLYNAIKLGTSKRAMFGFLGLSIFLIMSFYICFSRGAIYAFGIAGAIMGITLLIRDKSLRASWLILPVLIGCACGLLLQGVWAEMSPTNENFAQGIQRSIHQITLGKIDIREKIESGGDESTFSGYIEESTDIRLNINELAMGAWGHNNIWTGVGVGGAGTAISEYTDQMSSKEIIQNEYINTLVEFGIIGVVLFLIFIITIVKSAKKFTGGVFLIPLIIAYLITLCFFSGFPNVLHIYLFTPILYWVGQKHLLC